MTRWTLGLTGLICVGCTTCPQADFFDLAFRAKNVCPKGQCRPGLVAPTVAAPIVTAPVARAAAPCAPACDCVVAAPMVCEPCDCTPRCETGSTPILQVPAYPGASAPSVVVPGGGAPMIQSQPLPTPPARTMPARP